jgi:hypothetical protein
MLRFSKSFKIPYSIIYLSFLQIFSVITSIFPAEIILSNGDIFIADIIYEDSQQVKINWKNKVYTLPKKEILKVDATKIGNHKSFRPIDFKLKDGSSVKGIIVQKELNFLVIKSELGFIKVEKNKIESEIGDYEEDFPPPTSLSQLKSKGEYTRLGISGGSYSTDSTVNDDYKQGIIGGLFVEPSFFYINHWLRLGVDINSLRVPKKESRSILEFYNQYQVVSNLGTQNLNSSFILNTFPINRKEFLQINTLSPYLQVRWNPNRYTDFVFNLGLGLSNYTFTENKASYNTGSSFVSISYQGLSFDKVLIRFTVRSFVLFETGNSIRSDGAEFGIGYII